MRPHWIVDFEHGRAEERELLGGKGANLAEMTRLGLPVPPGFIVTTEACRSYLDTGSVPKGLRAEVEAAVERLGKSLGRRLGDGDAPLLLSVRSGAAVSMPGMMDTILNLGLNSTTAKGLARASGDERFALDSWRRFIDMYGQVVLEVPTESFVEARRPILGEAGVDDAAELHPADIERVLADQQRLLEAHGVALPDDPMTQLMAAIEAVFASWNTKRARDYRRHEGIPDDLGTAVNVQAMVFGNLGDDSGSGVVFTRDPTTGAHVPYGDFLLGAQGEDVVSGTRMTEPYAAVGSHFPVAASELAAVLDRLESRYRDMCDVEFTIEHGRLWVLQTRIGKRSAAASLRIAVDMAEEGLITREEAVHRFRPDQLAMLLHPGFDPSADRTVLTTGLAASPGAASGKVALTCAAAEDMAAQGDDVILVRTETSPDDLHGILASKGVLTTRGGLVSHAAVVARGMGKPAVCGADELVVDLPSRTFRVGATTVAEGDVISLDGATGEVVVGEVPVVASRPSHELKRLLEWADGFRRLGVRANADTPEDARRARELGAEGIGLCRTEHMFLGNRLPVLQRAILATGEEDRARELDRLYELQRQDFEELLAAMDGLPVTVRLLDPPLHEFLPDPVDLLVRQAEQGALTPLEEQQLAAAQHWQEHNPMLGIRGVRLALLQPDLYAMQARALADATVARMAVGGTPIVQIMIPLATGPEELSTVFEVVGATLRDVEEESDTEFHIALGTMIETPRAALVAGELAELCSFCSFGTNDLTQLTYGFSRDDVEARLMPRYLELGLLERDPFATIDVHGVGQLVIKAVESGRHASPGTHFGVCGEHGGDPTSIAFFEVAGLDYVSCSPFRVPEARLAAAHATIETVRD